MTRKDYILISSAVARAAAHDDPNTVGSLFDAGIERVAQEIAQALQRDNPNFDAERFLEDCEVI